MEISISDAEWRILEVIWEEEPLSADQIVDRIQPISTWKPKTVKTLINRLVQKGILSFNKEGRRYLYYPLVTQKDCLRKKNRNFLKTIYGGATKSLFVAFVDDFIQSDEELEEVRELLKEKERQMNERKK